MKVQTLSDWGDHFNLQTRTRSRNENWTLRPERSRYLFHARWNIHHSHLTRGKFVGHENQTRIHSSLAALVACIITHHGTAAVGGAREALSRVSARCVDNCQRYIRAGFLITPLADPRTIMANAFSPRSRIEPKEISLSTVSSASDVLRVLDPRKIVLAFFFSGPPRTSFLLVLQIIQIQTRVWIRTSVVLCFRRSPMTNGYRFSSRFAENGTRDRCTILFFAFCVILRLNTFWQNGRKIDQPV